MRVSSRRGALEVAARYADGLRPGLAFMTLHFPDLVDTNLLTVDVWDPKSGTAEFKATAIRIDKLSDAVDAAEHGEPAPQVERAPWMEPATQMKTTGAGERQPLGSH